jgi:hypothetical protein
MLYSVMGPLEGNPLRRSRPPHARQRARVSRRFDRAAIEGKRTRLRTKNERSAGRHRRGVRTLAAGSAARGTGFGSVKPVEVDELLERLNRPQRLEVGGQPDAVGPLGELDDGDA